MYRFLVLAIVIAVAGLELSYPTTETTTRIRGMLPEVQLAAVLTPQTAVASETISSKDPAQLWELRRVNHTPPPDLLKRKRFHSGF